MSDTDFRELSCKRRLAAKTYTCADCGGVILRNTLYYRIVYLHDGKFGYGRSHSPDGQCAFLEHESDPAKE